jgi:hypothetical protein
MLTEFTTENIGLDLFGFGTSLIGSVNQFSGYISIRGQARVDAWYVTTLSAYKLCITLVLYIE